MLVIVTCECECGVKEKDVKVHQDKRLLQLIMGKNDTCIGVRSNILSSYPLFIIDQTYFLVIEENKKKIMSLLLIQVDLPFSLLQMVEKDSLMNIKLNLKILSRD